MKQLNFLKSNVEKQRVVKKKHLWKVFIDGASRGNPGKAGAGICLFRDDEKILEQGFFLGKKTNNQAEYMALLLGVFFSTKYLSQDDILHVVSDSQLLVRQMNNVYKVKDAHLAVLKNVALSLLEKISSYTVEHVMRHKNVDADCMANYGIDKKIEIPKSFLNILKKHEVT